MLSLGPSTTEIHRDVLETPGAFAWWYLDISDDAGTGVVCIWSYGLPFLPGYASACRRDDAPPAGSRPSLNVCVYEGGQLDCYLLQEFPADDIAYPEPGHWQFGETTIRSLQSAGRRRVSIDVDCRIPGADDRLTGSIEMEGTHPDVTALGPDKHMDASDADSPPEHEWRLLTAAADGDVRLSAGDREYAFTGRGYHDCNAGARPFIDLGIGYWLWGRISDGVGEKIFYALWPDADGNRTQVTEAWRGEPLVVGYSLEPDGTLSSRTDLDLRLGPRRSSLGGMRWWDQIELEHDDGTWLSIDYADPVDSGPFYLRFLTESDHAHGVSECIAPHRIDLARHRPLVNMRVDHLAAHNSMWLPLFSGPRAGRLKRLMTQWW